MGRIFSWNEIEEKKIPQLQNFTNLVNQIRKELEILDGIIGGILFGSMLWNNHNQRSDIDCLLVYNPIAQKKVFKVLNYINKIASDFYIPLEIIPLDLRIIKTSLHHIGLSFADHLNYAVKNGGIIKTNPLPFFIFNNKNKDDDIREYLKNKLRKLEKGLSAIHIMKDADLYRFLQKILEAPVHVARKILWWQNIKMPNDSKQTVSFHYLNIANQKEKELFIKINAIDSQYTTELLKQLKNPNKIEYNKIINEIKKIAWDTLKFVKLNAFRIDQNSY